MMDAKAQVEALMNEVLPFAERMLAEHGEFHPFGGYLDPARRVVHAGARPKVKNATAARRHEMLIEAFKEVAKQKKAIAFAVVANVSLSDPTGDGHDAIKVFLEHVNGYCAEVFFRYEVRDGAIEITDTLAQQGEKTFWV